MPYTQPRGTIVSENYLSQKVQSSRAVHALATIPILSSLKRDFTKFFSIFYLQ